jgi:hypothetical protein
MGVKGDRIAVGMSKLAKALHEAVGENSVYKTSVEWGLPPWILRDVMSGKIDCPSPKYLRTVAKGLGWTVEEVIDAAYAVPA